MGCCWNFWNDLHKISASCPNKKAAVIAVESPTTFQLDDFHWQTS
jgi:hypothetical protein